MVLNEKYFTDLYLFYDKVSNEAHKIKKTSLKFKYAESGSDKLFGFRSLDVFEKVEKQAKQTLEA